MPTRGPLTLAAALMVSVAAIAGCSIGGPASPVSTSSPLSARPDPPTTAPATPPTVVAYTFPPGMLAGALTNGEALFTRMDAVLALPSTPGPHPVAVIVPGSYPICIWAGRDPVVTDEASTMPWDLVCNQTPVGASSDSATGTFTPSSTPTPTGSMGSGSGGTGSGSMGPAGPADSRPTAGSTPAAVTNATTGRDYVRVPASFGYLAAELARRGIAALVIDVSAKDSTWSGSTDRDQTQRHLVTRHLQVLADLNSGLDHDLPWGAKAKGAFDLTKLAIVGHGSGGAFALSEALEARLPNARAVVALEPVGGSTTTDRTVRTPMPTFIVAGQCDERTSRDEVASLALGLGRSGQSFPVIYAELGNTTHIGLLAGGGSHTAAAVRAVGGPFCNPDALARPAATQAQVAQLTADFLTTAFAGGRDYPLGVLSGYEVSVRSLSSAASVSKVQVHQGPGAIAPRSIRFEEATDRVLPPLPPGARLTIHPTGS